MCALLGVVSGISHVPGRADVFTLEDDRKQLVEVEGKLVADRRGLMAIERASGRIEVAPTARVRSRTESDGPTPLTAEELAASIVRSFGEKRCRVHVAAPWAIVQVGPANRTPDDRVPLERAATFLESVQRQFEQFAAELELPLVEPRHSYPVIVFDVEQEFQQFARQVTEGQGLSVKRIAGFYDVMSNRLALRKSECTTFDTPLHEAIHLLAYNRGLFRRLAPIPAWFNEGLATGFEGDGKAATSGPTAVSARYAPLAIRAKRTPWIQLVRDDKRLQSDGLAGEGYAVAWAMHHHLLVADRDAYCAVMRRYGELEPLAEYSVDERTADWERIVGVPIVDWQRAYFDRAKSTAK